MKKKVCSVTICAAVCAAGLCIRPVPVSAVPASVFTQQPEELSISGAEKNGLIQEGGNWYYYEDGSCLTEQWMTVENDTYYFGADGAAAVCSRQIDGTYYVFDGDGRLLHPASAEIVKVQGKDDKTRKYYTDTDGTAISGWSEDRNYYFDETGEMVAGITVIKEKFYCFNSGGKYNKARTLKIRKTAKYEKPFAALKKYIGKPQKAKYYVSCYGKGKDGILTYDGFQVYTFKPDSGAEIFMGAEQEV